MSSFPLIQSSSIIYEHIPEYKTIDLINNIKPVERKNENIVEEKVKPILLFQKFGNMSNVREKDEIYSMENKEYKEKEYVSLEYKNSKYEDPYQRLFRIKSEIAQFQKEVEEFNKIKNNTYASMCNNILIDLKDLNSKLPVIEAVSSQSKTTTGESSITSKSKETTQPNGHPNLKITSLESRISLLENLIGQNSINSSIPGSNLTNLVNNLIKKVDLLDKTKLDIITRKIKVISTDIDVLSKNIDKSNISLDNNSKISELYNSLNKWDAAAIELPAVITRLKSLARVHDASSNLANRIANIENKLKIVQETENQDKELLNVLGDRIKENDEVMKINLASIDQKVNDINEKVAKLK